MHSCPICGQACYCSGDIDDCEDHDTGEEYTGICICCEGREDRDDDPDFEEPECEPELERHEEKTQETP